MKSRLFLFSAFLVVLLSLAALPASPAQAQGATITVTRADDPPPDGCAPGDCSLREAVIAANATPAIPDTIDLPAGTYTLTLAGASEDASASGDLDITANLTMNGAGAATTIVEACDSSGGPCTGIDRVVHVLSGTAEMFGLTVRNGSEFGGVGGGGIYNEGGTVMLSSSTVSGNTAGNPGGGISNNQGTITLTNSTVSGNSAPLGGGIVDANPGAVITLANSTVSGNSASNNPASFGDGGGIYNEGQTVILNSSTVSGNSASGDGGGIWSFFGATLKNSIVANNTPSGSNCAFTITSLGHNLDSDGTCGLNPLSPFFDLPGVNPMLSPLALNPPGSTKTHALCTGAGVPDLSCGDRSPAIDTGLPTTDPDCSGGNDFDQRGVPRPQGAACDIGAYEFVPISAIPTLSAWGMLGLAGLLASLMAIALRQRGTS